MRVDLMIEGQEDVTWDQWVGLALACEEHDFESLFRSDHYDSVQGHHDRGSLDAWTTIAAIAARTERIRLGTLVSPVTFRHPSLLAKAVVTADHVSGGRVELGIGAGWNEHEHAAYGFPFPGTGERFDVLEEQIEIVHRQWTEDGFDLDGEHYRLEGCRPLPHPVQDPHPNLIVGGLANDRSAGLAARWAGDHLDGLRDQWVIGTPGEVVDRLGVYTEHGVDRIMLQHQDHHDLEMVALIGAEVVPEVAR